MTLACCSPTGCPTSTTRRDTAGRSPLARQASATASSTIGPVPNWLSRPFAVLPARVLRLVKRLLDTGISLQQIRTAVNQLREAGVNDLAQTTLMSDGASVYLCTSDDEVIDLVSRGQGVFGIAVGKVLREVESSLTELDSVKGEDPADELAQRRATRAS